MDSEKSVGPVDARFEKSAPSSKVVPAKVQCLKTPRLPLCGFDALKSAAFVKIQLVKSQDCRTFEFLNLTAPNETFVAETF